MKLIMENWRRFLLEQESLPNLTINRERDWTPAEPKPDMWDSGIQDWQILLQPEILIPNIKLAMRITPRGSRKPEKGKWASAACDAYYALSSLMPERPCSPPFLVNGKPGKGYKPPDGCRGADANGNYSGSTLTRGDASVGDRPVNTDAKHGAKSISGAPTPPLGPGSFEGLDLPEKQLGSLLLNKFGKRYKLNTAQDAMEFFLKQMRWRCSGEKYGPPKDGPLRTIKARATPAPAPSLSLPPEPEFKKRFPHAWPAENKTKISKNRLQKIIREEVNLVLKDKSFNINI